jgi:hypothetical protein
MDELEHNNPPQDEFTGDFQVTTLGELWVDDEND